MALTLYLHPLASFCQKVLIALYEKEIAFAAEIVDLGDREASAPFLDLWPVGKIPVLRDTRANRVIPETTIIIEHLDQYSPQRPLLPRDPAARLEARLWDRFFDLYVQVPMQKIVTDRLRPAESRDPFGVEEARAILRTAYDMIERQLSGRDWAAGTAFTLADCAAAPALFYAGVVAPFADSHPATAAYFERLLSRPAFRRTLDEARPYFPLFPYKEALPERFWRPLA
jgi:glutathione S-transferase